MHQDQGRSDLLGDHEYEKSRQHIDGARNLLPLAAHRLTHRFNHPAITGRPDDHKSRLPRTRLRNPRRCLERRNDRRKNRTSVVTAFQAAAWVPKASTRQATFVVIWPTRDRGMIKAVCEAMGREWQEVSRAIDMLPRFFVLVIPKQVRAPLILVHPPKL